MYTPPAYAETDLAELDRLFAGDAFVTLVTVAGGEPFASHLPVLYQRDGERVELRGHWARPNPQWRHAGPALAIVHGPHHYVSPAWYPDKEEQARVPTWNYAVAHLHGRLVVSEDAAELAGIVGDLSDRHEAAVGSDWRFDPEREDLRVQLRGIVGFRFVPERIELKFKLNQNHPAARTLAAATAMSRLPGERARGVSTLMFERLARREGKS